MESKKSTYDTASMVLHWSIAVLVFSVGLSSPFLDHQSRPALSTFHNVGGTLAMLLAVIWIVWQFQRPAVPSIPQTGPAEKALMKWSVALLNVLLIVASVSGLLLLFAHGGSLGVGAFEVTHRIPVDQAATQRLGLMHHVLGALLVMIAGGHALHSVWHHVVRRDRLLARILPGHEH